MSKPEALVVVGDEQERRDLERFLSDLGLKVSALRDGTQALEAAERQPPALALLDVDTPTPGAGLELLWSLKRIHPPLPVVLLCTARSFDTVLSALRAGAADVVVKAPDQIDYLRQRVTALSSQKRVEREQLLGESLALNEEFLRRLTDMARKVGDLRDQLLSASSGTSPLPDDEECRVLVVEEDGWLAQALAQALPKGFMLRSVVSAGSALDKASAQRFHIALVKEGLPDLPGRMVVRTLQRQSPDTVTLLFTPPGDKPGQVQVVDKAQAITLLASFTDAQQLGARLVELREAQRARGRERRYLAAFREEHYDLLRRYAEFKQKLKP